MRYPFALCHPPARSVLYRDSLSLSLQMSFQFVTLDALNVLLKKVQPSENGLLPFDACVAWLKSVKSIKPWVEWISLDNYQLQFYQKKKKLLESVL